MHQYTKQEVISAVIRHMATWDTGRPHLNAALELSETQTKILGIIDLALPERRNTTTVSRLGARVKRSYPKTLSA